MWEALYRSDAEYHFAAFLDSVTDVQVVLLLPDSAVYMTPGLLHAIYNVSGSLTTIPAS